jgi:phosphopantothenoylcysteine decarboxylase
MAHVLLGVTGSVAAIYTPELVLALREAGHSIQVVTTRAAEYFFDRQRLEADGVVLVRDADEWPGDRYRRGDPVVHIELRRWADVLLVAPLDANTLAKFALGLCDNCLTCVYRAWDRGRPVLLAPAMNTFMWDHPATARHLDQIRSDLGEPFVLIEPEVKKLACDDIGIGALASRATILEAVAKVVPARPDS